MELNKSEREQFLGVKVDKGMELYTSDLVPPYLSHHGSTVVTMAHSSTTV